jgi:type II secretion system (T2SS) protein G
VITKRALLAVDIANGVIVAALLPVSFIAVRALSDACTSSHAEFERALYLWWISTAVVATLVYAGIGLPAHGVLRRLVVVVVAVFLFGIALPSLDAGSLDRSRQKRTMADMRTFAEVLERYRMRTGSYPPLRSVTQLQRDTSVHLPTTDAWGNAFRMQSGPYGYSIRSYGLCGQPDSRIVAGELLDVHGDIILINGRFVTYPAGFSSDY